MVCGLLVLGLSYSFVVSLVNEGGKQMDRGGEEELVDGENSGSSTTAWSAQSRISTPNEPNLPN